AGRDGALLGERDRVLPAAATELEHALALEVTAQAEVGFGGDVGAVRRDVGGEAGASLIRGRVPVPCGGVVRGHGAKSARLACVADSSPESPVVLATFNVRHGLTAGPKP